MLVHHEQGLLSTARLFALLAASPFEGHPPCPGGRLARAIALLLMLKTKNRPAGFRVKAHFDGLLSPRPVSLMGPLRRGGQTTSEQPPDRTFGASVFFKAWSQSQVVRTLTLDMHIEYTNISRRYSHAALHSRQ
jgi:hypothetical protein